MSPLNQSINRPRCTGHKKSGEACGRWPTRGTTVCTSHGAKAPQVAAKAAVRAELMDWGLGSADVSPEEILLRLISQSATRAERLAATLETVVTQNGGDLSKAMVGDSLITTSDGDVVKSGEYIRGLTQLESTERDRLAGFCAKAIAAGLAKRQVDLAERQGAMMATVLRMVLCDPELGLTDEQRRLVPAVTRRHLAITG